MRALNFHRKDTGQALICGGGPSGLVAAITLHQLGWQDIVLVERRDSQNAFERGKAFNYQIDGRGQRALASIGLDTASIKEYGVANTRFTVHNIRHDGTEKTFTLPFIREDKQTAYWTTRTALMEMLYERIQAVNTDGRIRLLHGHAVDSMHLEGGELRVGLRDGFGAKQVFAPRLVLGCDGVNSAVRTLVADLPHPKGKYFTMAVSPSASSALMYKVIRLPRNISVAGKADVVIDPDKAYVFSSSFTEPKQRMSLFSLPVARQSEPRTANIILPRRHQFWDIESEDALVSYLREGFPQLDIGKVFPDEEIADFLALKPGQFPEPQYSLRLHAELGTASAPVTCILLGDAAHAFPPDLGLGVNSAMEDVELLGVELARPETGISEAAARFEEARLPEVRALVRLVRKVFPYQYNHVPWRLKLFMAKFLAQLGLSKLSLGLIDEPGFRLCQDERLSYTEVEKRIRRAELTFYALLATLVAAPLVASMV